MAQDRESRQVNQTPPLRPEESINTTSADPEATMREIPIGEADVVAAPVPYGEMNEADARESGYLTDDESKTTH